MSNGRKIYLINPEFQIKFSLFISILLFVISIIYPFTIYELMNSIVSHLNSIMPNIAQDYEGKKKQIIIYLVLLQLSFTGLTFFICIFFSHRIAGPLYKLQKYLREYREGTHGTHRYPLSFRKGDYFQEVATDINLTLDQIEEEHKKDLVYISEVTTYINNLSLVVPEDKRVVLNEIIVKLNEIQNRFHSKE